MIKGIIERFKKMRQEKKKNEIKREQELKELGKAYFEFKKIRDVVEKNLIWISKKEVFKRETEKKAEEILIKELNKINQCSKDKYLGSKVLKEQFIKHENNQYIAVLSYQERVLKGEIGTNEYSILIDKLDSAREVYTLKMEKYCKDYNEEEEMTFLYMNRWRDESGELNEIYG